MLIIKNLDVNGGYDFPSLRKGLRIVFGVIYQYAAGLAGLTDMLVSVYDIIICGIWFVVGIGFCGC